MPVQYQRDINYHRIVEKWDEAAQSQLQIHASNSSGNSAHSLGLQLTFV